MDLCHPLLVGILSEKEEDDFSEGEEVRRSEVFLRIKQGLVLEVDMQRGQERCRLELNSLARVETTEAAWSRLVRAGRRCSLLLLKCVLTFSSLISGQRRNISSGGASF